MTAGGHGALQGPALGCSLAEVQSAQLHAQDDERLILLSTGGSDLVRCWCFLHGCMQQSAGHPCISVHAHRCCCATELPLAWAPQRMRSACLRTGRCCQCLAARRSTLSPHIRSHQVCLRSPHVMAVLQEAEGAFTVQLCRRPALRPVGCGGQIGAARRLCGHLRCHHDLGQGRRNEHSALCGAAAAQQAATARGVPPALTTFSP